MVSLRDIRALDVICAFAGVCILTALARRKTQKAPLPPGPKGYPLVGNILDMPSKEEWKTFSRWGKQYGDISSITVLGRVLVILNSAKVINEILEKKSQIYSERPVMHFGGELIGWKYSLALLSYGDRFRRYRRMIADILGSRKSMGKFEHVELLETHKFLRRVLDDPVDLATHVRHTAGAIILRISHGYEVKDHNDPLVELADKAMEQFSISMAPGAFLVDVLPILRHIPAWFPGAGFQKKAKEWSATLHELIDRPHSLVKREMAQGTAPSSYTSKLLETDHNFEEEIKWSAASIYSGGADTTVSAIYSFFLAMTLHPDVVKKAQAEIDSIVGHDRLPTFDDRPHLPYLEALTKEVVRWNTVVPIGPPHAAAQDDVHDGYLIPKGSLIMANIRGILHDPEVYSEPHIFNPDRFIANEGKPTEPDPRAIAFGFGRRICPGIHLAEASIYISCAMSLAVFDIRKSVENGVVVEPTQGVTDGLISHPKPFKCSITPRSERAVNLIRSEGE